MARYDMKADLPVRALCTRYITAVSKLGSVPCHHLATPLAPHRQGPVLTDVVPGAVERGELLLLEMVNRQDVGQDHDHHRDVEGEQGSEDEEVLIVHLADLGRGHDVLDVEDGEDGYGGGQEEAEAPGENHFVKYGVLALGPLSERSPDAPVPADGDEHEVEDGHGAGQHVAGLVEHTPTLRERPTT